MTKKASELLPLADKMMRNYRQPPIVMQRGSGSRIWDTEGNQYLDFSGGIAVLSVGHAHPTLAKAIGEQAARLMHTSNLFFSETELAFGQALTEATGFDRVLFCSSGTEANEALFKLARRYHFEKNDKARTNLVSTWNGFHGRSMGALALTGQPKYHQGFEPMVPGVLHLDYNDLAAMDKAIDEKTAAVILEPIQAEGGIIVGKDEYLQGVRKLCTERGALLFFDEVQTGYGRTGKFLGGEWSGVSADAISLAKGIGGGFPLGAIAIREFLNAGFPTGSHGSTYGGNPLACAAGLAVLEIFKAEGLVQNALETGAYLEGLLHEIVNNQEIPAAKSVRGRGLLLGVQLSAEYDALASVAKMREHKVLASIAGADVIRLAPWLGVSRSDCDQAVEALTKTLQAAPRKI